MAGSPQKTIGVGQCRVCGQGRSLLKTHICPECAAEDNRQVRGWIWNLTRKGWFAALGIPEGCRGLD